MAGERTVRIRFVGIARDLVRAARQSEDALERFDRMADNLGKTAGRVGKAVASMVGPATGPIIGAATVATAGLASSLVSAGAAVGVFGAVLKSTQSEVTEVATKNEDLRAKIQLYAKQAELAAAAGKNNETYLKKQAAATLELRARLANLPPETRNAAMAFLQLRSDWEGFVDANKPATFNLLTRGYALLNKNITNLQPLFNVAQRAADQALGAVERWASGGGIQRLVTFLATQGAASLTAFMTIARNVFTFLGSLLRQTAGDGQGVLDWLVEMSARLAAFGTGGGLAAFLDNTRSNGPAVVEMLASLAAAAVSIAQAVTPLAPISLAIASALAQLIAALPPRVITALVAAWVAYRVALAAYNVVMGTVAVTTKVAAGAQKVWLALTKSGAVATAAATVAERARGVAIAAIMVAQRTGAAVTAAWTAATNLLTLSNIRAAAMMVASTTATVAMSVAQRAAAAATAIATLATRGLSAAWAASPIGFIITIIALLVAGIVALYKNNETARRIIDAAWKAIAAAAQWLWNNVLKPVFNSVITQFKLVAAGAMWLWNNGIKPAFNGAVATVQFLWNGYKRYIQLVVNIIKSVASTVVSLYNTGRDYFNRLVSYIGGLPGRISRAASGLFDGIRNAFRNAINWIIDRWNGLSFSLPSINTPFGKIGGTTLSTPNIGRLASGGWAQPYATYTVNERGQELLTMGSRRGYVHSAGDTAAMTQPPEIHVYIGDRELTDMVDVRIEESNRQLRRSAGAYGLRVAY